ncbi:carbohydrate ABC transporter permease [Microbacterium murale]|uniref:Sugar ABC transporter permease n=1 Tax=Microbacterium murale TaxID=1081040 RepID=A0ABQ1S4A8_9MICO|nr:sugar ABC transporter permease [Microbacterium murale]GGD89053.1 sugar ABC transporter permease [Microbacterium murale]
MSARPGRLTPYLFILPAAAIYGVFLIVPLVQTAVMSFWKWDGLSPVYEWIGFDNYVRMFSDGTVWSAAGNNLKWVVLAVFPIVIGLALALILQQARPRGRTAYRAIYFLPYVLPTVVVALAWGWIYHPSFGTLNSGLEAIGLGALAQNWTGDSNLALFALATAANWTGFGFCMTLFLSGLNAVDPALYDAAKVDGTSAWQRFRYVTLPAIANTTNIVVLVVFINTVRVFDIVFVMTGGGPAGATEVLGTKIYRGTFQDLDIGYGSAIAMFMVLLILVTTVVYLRSRERDNA